MTILASVRSKLIAGAVITLTALGVVPAAVPSASAAIVPVQGCTLDGAPVLPGFALPVAELFAELDRHG